MVPSVVEIGSPGLYLSKTRGFLSIKDSEGGIIKLPLDDIGVLVITSPQATLSTALMNTLAERGIVALLCNTKHQPASYLYPVKPHEELTGRLLDQIRMSKPLKNRLWQSVVKAKILHQGLILEACGRGSFQRLFKLSAEVSSGDKENREAQAARVYWQALFGENFRRKPRGEGINNILDFGYGILRSAILRAIAGSGVNPSLGLAHSNRMNPFCLADDLMEPFRPIVDIATYSMKNVDEAELTPRIKKNLAHLIAVPLETSLGNTPLFRSMFRMIESLVRTHTNQKNELEIPRFPKDICKTVSERWQNLD